MKIEVTREALEEIRNSSAASAPMEACGLLLGRKGEQRCVIAQAVTTPNVHPTPATHFEVEPQALIDAYREERNGGLQVVGYFHSHPIGEAVPSAEDQRMSPGDGRIWAIVSNADVRLWRDEPEGFASLSFEIQTA